MCMLSATKAFDCVNLLVLFTMLLLRDMNRNHRTIVVLMFSLLFIARRKLIRRPWKLPSTAQCFVLPNINDCILIEFCARATLCKVYLVMPQ